MPDIIGDVNNRLHNPHLQCIDDDNHKDIYHELGDDKQIVYHPVGTIATVIPIVPDTLHPRETNVNDIPTVWPLHHEPAGRNLYTIEANYKAALVGIEWPFVQLQPNTRHLMKITWQPDVKITADGKPDSLRVRCRLDVYGTQYSSDWHVLQEHQIGSTQETLFLVHNWQVALVNVHAEFWLVNGGIDERVRVERVELIEVPNTFGTNYLEIGTPTTEPPPPNPDPDPQPEPNGCVGWLYDLFNIRKPMEAQMKVENLPSLLKSKRFWTGLLGLIFMIVIRLWPEMESHVPQLTEASLLVISLIIGGYVLEDIQKAKK